MEIRYRCHSPENMHPDTWTGSISILKCGDTLEAEVCARGSSFHMIAGRHSYGNFICIPGWGIGTNLAALTDRLWNYERLRQEYPGLSKVDAVSIADALAELSVLSDA